MVQPLLFISYSNFFAAPRLRRINAPTRASRTLIVEKSLRCSADKLIVRLMVSAADKLAKADLLWEKNIITWLISQTDKFEQTAQLSPT